MVKNVKYKLKNRRQGLCPICDAEITLSKNDKHDNKQVFCPMCKEEFSLKNFYIYNSAKKCPLCGEEVKKDAIRCKHCKSQIEGKVKSKKYDEVKKVSVPLVECGYCGNPIYGRPRYDFMGFRIYICSSCGIRTKYPFNDFYLLIYICCILFFVLGVCSLFIYEDGGEIGCCGFIGLIAIPFVLINQSIKNKIPNYDVRMKNSEKYSDKICSSDKECE